MSYTGQTLKESPETSDAGEQGIYLKDNYMISTGPNFIVGSLQFVKSEVADEFVDEEAIKILEDKTYKGVLTQG